jgi:hypothetical protein
MGRGNKYRSRLNLIGLFGEYGELNQIYNQCATINRILGLLIIQRKKNKLAR